MDVSVQQFTNFLEMFHSRLQQVAGEYLPEPARSELLHLAPLPATIQAYISTSFGLGWEYRKANQTRVKVRTVHTRIENVLIAAPERFALRENAPVIFSIVGSDITMTGAGTLEWGEGQFGLRLDGPDASCRIVGVNVRAGNWARLIPHAEMYANKSASAWTREGAVTQADEEVLAALLELKLARARDVPIADYIKEYKDKKVLEQPQSVRSE